VIRVTADPTGKLAFVQKSLSARPGKITFVFTNISGVPHDLAVERMGARKGLGATPIIEGGKSARLNLTLKKGTYTFDCTVDGHEAAGMKGTLTVR
jgi:plastocyanin